MIDKIQPRKLDRDTDQKLVQKTSMIDALNVYVDENLSGEDGNAGVIKPVLGTDGLSFTDGTEIISPDVRVLGSTVDDLTNVMYFYVWANRASEQGVYAYDHDSVLSDQGGLVKVFTSEVFNFPPDGFVTGDVVYKRKRRQDDSDLPDVDSILYFTDGVNEPRKLDIYRALFAGDFTDVSPIPTETSYEVHDVICACPKVPMGNIDFEFTADSEKEVSNFENTPGIQFAMQGVYTDGSITAIGPYSRIAFPRSIVNRGAAPAASVLNDNLCKIKIPEIQEDIETIKILYRYGNKASFRELAEVPNKLDNSFNDENWNQGSREYSFYNDQVSTGVSPSDVAKTFDNLPRQARAQSAISNRLVFSNFKDGYDPYRPEVTTTVLFKKRPSEGVDFTVDLRPTIEKIDQLNEPNVFNKSMGFEIGVDQIPDNISEDTTISVAFSFSPDKNFHVYEARGGFQQSQHLGPASGNFRGLELEPVIPNGASGNAGVWSNGGTEEDCGDIVSQVGGLVNDGSPASMLFQTAFETEGWINARKSGQGSTDNEPHNFYSRGLAWDESEDSQNGQPDTNAVFGRNFGVGYRADHAEDGTLSNTYPYQGYPLNEESLIEECCSWSFLNSKNQSLKTRAAYGTSAGAPLIIQGTKLSFDLSFKITQDIGNGQDVVAQSIHDIMVGRSLTHSSVVDVVSVNNVYNYSMDVGLTDGKKIFQTDPEKNLITMVTDVGNSFFDGDGDGESDVPPGEGMMSPGNLLTVNQITHGELGLFPGRNRRIPAGYFILNKADVTFFFEPEIRDTVGIRAFHLAIADVVPHATQGIYTCVKRAEPQAPWRAYSKSTIENFLTVEDAYDNYDQGIPQNDKYLINDKFDLLVESLEDSNDYFVNGKMVGVIRCKENDDTNGQPFWPCKIDVGTGTDYAPRGDSMPRYRFSLLDGAGGPGGTPPGSLSAYGRYENNRFGSVAGQMIATFYGVHDDPIRPKLQRAVPSIGEGFEDEDSNWDNGAKGVRDVSVIGGVLKDISIPIVSPKKAEIGKIEEGYGFGDPAAGDGTEYIKTRAVARVNNSQVPTQTDIRNSEQFGNSGFDDADVCHIAYTLTGPFFTGGIAMNPIASASNGEDGGLKRKTGDNFGQKALQGVYEDDSTLTDYRFINGFVSPINQDQQFTPKGAWDQTTTMPYIFSGSTSPQVHNNQTTYKSVFPWPIIANNDSVEIVDGGAIAQLNAALVDNLYGTEGGSGFLSQHPAFGSISWADRPGHAEIGSVTTSATGSSSKPIMSFKANANHEFGVIYYDERGRHGRVNHIGSVYVPGFSPAERNGITDGGPSHIRINFNSPAPDWAHYYKIAYSKNTSISTFFQYSAGGAFITASDNPVDSGLNSAKIYVSLNYLQGHPISYSDSWGGRSQEGSPVVYQPKEGDKVRVISHQRSSSNQVEKVFPKNIVFDVIGVESLGDSVAENPLTADSLEEVPPNKRGLFLTIKNNPENTGFSYADIEQDNHFWGSNCIIEIFRPVDSLDEESRIYYEIGPTYRCGKVGGSGPNHHLNEFGQPQPIEVVDGDVFFRKTAVNLREFEDGEFVDLIRKDSLDINSDSEIQEDEMFDSAEPNFKSIYTEALSASDLFKSDAISIGRPNKIDNNEKEVTRIASMVHSDRDITKSSKLGYSSFNRTESNDKDLDVTHGQIDYTANTDDSILIIQKNKVGHVPVDRNLISTADNEPSLISSSKFLGTARYYAGKGGSDGHPESIAMADGNAYFAHKTDGKVFRASGANGLLEISNKAMKSFFRNLFSLMGKNDKIIGGYDPIKQEYLINVQAVEEPTDQNGIVISQNDSPSLTFNTEFLENSSDTSAQFSGNTGGAVQGDGDSEPVDTGGDGAEQSG
tara:strand:- start:1065 stop:6656 length:5592 start_codon:yes stop_codon:yes gene_type:complete